MRIDTPIPKHVFVERFRHEIFGMVMEARIDESRGTLLSQNIRARLTRVDELLEEMHEFLTAAIPVAVSPLNGRK